MSYPIETKIALVREYEQGKKVAEVSKTSGIPENSIYRWIREYHTIKTASSSFTPVEYYKLQKHSAKTSLTQAFCCLCKGHWPVSIFSEQCPTQTIMLL